MCGSKKNIKNMENFWRLSKTGTFVDRRRNTEIEIIQTCIVGYYLPNWLTDSNTIFRNIIECLFFLSLL